MNSSNTETISNAKEIVLACVNAINNEDFNTAREYVSDQLSFIGVLGSRDGADAYFADMGRMKLKYKIKKTFSDESDVCLLYDLSISGKMLFCCGWYHVTDGKIESLKVIFDPRPILGL